MKSATLGARLARAATLCLALLMCGNTLARSMDDDPIPRRPNAVPPTVPVGLTANAASPTLLRLSWQPADPLLGFNVYRDGVRIAVLPYGTTSFEDSGVTSGTTYTYGVSSRNSIGQQSAQATMEATLPGTWCAIRDIGTISPSADSADTIVNSVTQQTTCPASNVWTFHAQIEDDPGTAGCSEFEPGLFACYTTQYTPGATFDGAYYYYMTSDPGSAFPLRYTLSNPEVGSVTVQGGVIDSGIATPINVVNTPTLATRTLRPTLFVSIPGSEIDGPNYDTWSGFESWQGDLDTRLQSLIDLYQYRHIEIDWQSGRPVGPQVERAFAHIKDFLGQRVDDWDVVLVGFSRGGIFAQELAERLAGRPKIKRLHVILLDPTAAQLFGDTYPSSLPPGAFGFLRYDGSLFTNLAGFPIGTLSDAGIPGYTNYGAYNFYVPDVSHANVPTTWLANDYAAVIAAINGMKVNEGAGSFVVDGASGLEQFILRSERISASLQANCANGGCALAGQIHLGLATSTLSGAIGRDGIEIAASNTIAAGAAVIRRNELAIAQGTPFSSESVRVNADGVRIETNRGGVSVLHSLSRDGVQFHVTVDANAVGATILTVSLAELLVPGSGAAIVSRILNPFHGL